MSIEDENINALEHSVKSCYSTWGERYYDDYYASEDAYPPVHTRIVRELLSKSQVTNVLDAGCGPASMLRDLVDLDIELYGFDLTPEMVTEARRVLSLQDISPENVWTGSVIDKLAFRGGPLKKAKYDSGICFGVFPHIPAQADKVVLQNLASAIAPGGLIAIEARNELFSLFSLNRYSYAFYKERLIQPSKFNALTTDEETKLTSMIDELGKHFSLDLPPLRKGYQDEPGYDEVLSRSHNPFELKSLAEEIGLVDVELLFYHYHAFPPILEALAPEMFRRQSIAMENPRDWRGYFMASAFILVGKVADRIR
ncbi:MAG: class I SAM-dependent methyltransferase [Thalassospira sp.]|uniref:class I SAM-dependent methyltransferase n=1 Tax=Thalassospira sp. TaxID=1912094 RepID=UPI003A8C557B